MRTANVVSLDHSIFRLVTDALGIPGAIIGYGLTESTTVAVRNRWDDPAEARMTSQGHPLPGIELRIVDPESGAVCDPGTPGEIQLRGYCIMK
ncbi:AMP-binding protein, partial [Acinetobacter baumannii]